MKLTRALVEEGKMLTRL